MEKAPNFGPSVEEACHRAADACHLYLRHQPQLRINLLESCASALDAKREQILEQCAEETALTIEELIPEFARMVGTLRMFAQLVREGSWVRSAIDTRTEQSPVGPGHDVRRMLLPLGPVAVFGASNFPLAYGVCGGDTASALAAGCSVVVKEHPAHPRTGRLLARTVGEAIAASDAPFGSVNYVPHTNPSDHSITESLVTNRFIAAVGFTGSQFAGRRLSEIALGRPRPIPVFAEMGSINPVFLDPRLLIRQPDTMANVIADSILLRNGQQCTRPGVLIPNGGRMAFGKFAQALVERFESHTSREMLAPWIADSFNRRIEACLAAPGVEIMARGKPAEGPRAVQAHLLLVPSSAFVSNEVLREEIFGPAALWIEPDALLPHDIWRGMLKGNLTLSCFYDEQGSFENLLAQGNLPQYSDVAGRIVFNGPPTGVRVAAGMVHGGPFPATNRPDTTAVGPFAIERWCRPVCYQNCPDALLPPELQNANPRGILRLVNGQYTRDAIQA